ncbi:hypothetical protein SAMN06295974_3728 [Plantibacter flavus]|uniref:Uncharacterized protein n=1 Tax=Plantibacter flavus TaxID=150123 RepID=A0A3N2BM57_9MICO|nr:hypothetical protein [Plantibacter flavus]ROR76124.1 hypothetical protein EDD42_4077 [Plantibacter flavus]SMG48410.1 hypothetical protein SAMN06295974_3728 [Plantibacter flavus]
MSDEQQPSFLRGLPPRGAQPTVAAVEREPERDEPVATRGWRPNRLVLFVVAGFGLGLIALLVVGLVMINSATSTAGAEATGSGSAVVEGAEPGEPAAGEPAPDATAAVEGHEVSAELCAALQSAVSLSGADLTSTEVSPEQLAAFAGVAAIASPNQSSYQGFVDLLQDPASVPSEADAQALSAAFAQAAQADLVTCA